MLLLRTAAIICLVIGVIAFLVPSFPGAGLLKLGVVLAIVYALFELLNARRVV